MDNVLRITIPKEFLSRDMEDYLLWHRCRRVGEDESSTTFETFPHPIGVSFNVFCISTYKRKRDFYNKLIVRGGRKAFLKHELVINPLLDKEVGVRLTEEMYQFVREKAQKIGCSISGYFRSLISFLTVCHEPETQRERRGREIALQSFEEEIEI